MKPPVLIPAYQPGADLTRLVQKLTSDGITEVIIVDDGSSKEHEPLFSSLAGQPRVHLLRHAMNMGKGQALRTAFEYFLSHFPENCPGAVTADADGQHLPDDIAAVSRALTESPSALCLGTRDLKHNVPARSRFGNDLTRLVFRLFSGQGISDTQTGLRGIPRGFMRSLLELRSNRYEFELEMLLLAVRSGMLIRETPIKTVYLANNASSHFNPLIDSIRVYCVFIRSFFTSLTRAGKAIERKGP